jgi:eukaryotic-like serine/threonine-protein kinase
MSLAPGLRLGPYEIIGLVGSGGTGEVYRARDLRLGRVVALKLFNPDHEPTLRDDARLREEAKAIGSLAHPRICALHDISEHGGRTFLVIEFIEGETLAERLVRGRLPITEALDYAIQILEGLDHAHQRQVVHGDLKPSNVMITSGGIKLLDFGLARLRAPAIDLEDAPLSSTATAGGRFEGTVPYMAPEQLEAGVVDERSDIFAFGATFFEMLTGRRAFEGVTPATTVAAILERQPVWPSKEQVDFPEALELLVMTCLTKNADRRWQAARDLELQLRNFQHPVEREPVIARRFGRGRAAVLASAIALVTLTAAWYAMFGAALPSPRMQFVIEPPPQSAFASGAISSDGRQLAFFRVDAHDTTELWTRPLDSLDARRVDGTRGAAWQFWSPDGKAIGFFAGRRLKTIAASGGAPVDLASAPAAFGASWGLDGSIIYAPAAQGGLFRVAGMGGAPSQLTIPASTSGEISHRWPHFLPDGRRYLFLSWHREPGRRALYVGFLNGEVPKRLASIESAAVFAPPHYVLWTSGGTLFARRFDLERLEFSDSAQVVANDVSHSTNLGWSAVSASGNGAVVYQSLSPAVSQPTWFSRAGQQIAVAGDEGSYGDLSLAPDQKRLALTMKTSAGPSGVWQLDLQRGVLSHFAVEASAIAPIWSPDGDTILFAKNFQGAFRLFRKPSAGGSEEPVLVSDHSRTPSVGKQVPSDWSADGRIILFEADGDIHMLPLGTGGEPRALVRGPADEGHGRLSPDQKWMAFSSDASGRREVYVALVSNPERRWQVSSESGRGPLWRGDGQELFYVADDGTLMAVALRSRGDTLDPAVPAPLFKLRVDALSSRTFAASHDGQKFLVNHLVHSAIPRTTIILNWAGQ